jgi:hypothetical protein
VQSENDVEIHPDNFHDRTSNRNPGPYPFSFIGIAAVLGVVVFYFGLLTLTSASMAACCAHSLVPLLPALVLPFLSAALAGIVEHQLKANQVM